MHLQYAIEFDYNSSKATKKRGYAVITLNQKSVGTFKRIYEGEELAPNERLLHYHIKYGLLRIVPDSYMFQEGHAKFYSQAKYGVFKFDTKGGYVLVGLADDKMQIIQPNN